MPELREALDAAFEQHEEGSPSEPANQIPASPEPAEPASPEPAAAPIESTATATSEPSPDGRVRDAQGRFVKADPADGKGQVPAEAGKPLQGAVSQPEGHPQATPAADKVPAGVPATVREVWASLPPAVREYTAQREQQVQQVLSQTAQARQFAQSFMQAVQPFQQAIQIEAGGDPIRAVTGLMQVASGLRFGTPVEKARIVAQLVNTYGVDVMTLDSALAGAAPPQPQGFDPGIVQQAVQQALSPIMQAAQQRHQQQAERVATEVRSEIDKFAADPKNEFFADVREMMADAMEIAERQGRQLSLADAYSQACLLHPEVSKVILARQQGQQARTLTNAAQRAKAAAVSVKGAAPVGNPAPTEPSSVRDAIEAAIEAHSRV